MMMIKKKKNFYRPQTKFGDKVICLQVCVCPRGGLSWGGGWSRGGWLVPGVAGSGGCLVLGGGSLVRGCLVETPPDGYCCGRYASYWNAFLLITNDYVMIFFAHLSDSLINCGISNESKSVMLHYKAQEITQTSVGTKNIVPLDIMTFV